MLLKTLLSEFLLLQVLCQLLSRSERLHLIIVPRLGLKELPLWSLSWYLQQ